MKFKRFFSFFFAVTLVLSLLTPAYAADDFEVDARAALLIDVGSGEVLYEKNCHEQNYPASVTKVMTALLTLDAVHAGTLSFTQEITAQESAYEGLAPDGSTANIKAGEVMTVENLLNCLLIVSANEAAHILAEAVSGSIPAFVEQMNRRAEALGCSDTHFANPSGLHNEEHYTSAWDIYLITAEALKYEEFSTIVARKAYTVPATNVSKERSLHSTNYLISTWRTGWPGYYSDEARGIKTGSTPEAGYCLVANAVRAKRQLITVVLGAERVKREDGVIETRSFSETLRLFSHGFDDFKSMDLIDTSEFVCEVPVALSSEANYVVVHPGEELRRMVPVELTLDALERDIRLSSEIVDAPIAEGDTLGTMTVSYHGVDYGTVPLIALNDVSASRILTMERDVKAFLVQPWVRYAAAGLLLLILIVTILILRARSRRYRGRARRGGYSSGYRGSRRRR
ncbi:MAG: D-alanyl-D-alanine carboxypeptidase [Oscillospiraceae bacterium]|nr:D-alanyl-D-alanine carboxypeptidase [Oscillospiraceae bacterium]